MEAPGPYEAIVLADSIADGVRLTTMCATFPRFVLAEFNTHRMISRNSASSRAIPVKKRVAQISEAPVVPLSFGRNRRGMQAGTEEVAEAERAEQTWLSAMRDAVEHAARLAELGVHKQWANRLCETFAWHTIIMTATEWANYDSLRISGCAQPEICKVSEAMLEARTASTPVELKPGDWHLPLASVKEVLDRAEDEGLDLAREMVESLAVQLSVSRCAAVSFERHLDHDVDRDIARYGKLARSGHMSPFEHAARCEDEGEELTELDREIHSVEYIAKGGRTYGAPFSPRWTADPASYSLTAPRWKIDGYFAGNLHAPFLQHRKLLPGEFIYRGD